MDLLLFYVYKPRIRKKNWSFRKRSTTPKSCFTISNEKQKEVTHMYGIAITYGAVSLLLLGGFAYLTFRMTKKWLIKKKKDLDQEGKEDD